MRLARYMRLTVVLLVSVTLGVGLQFAPAGARVTSACNCGFPMPTREQTYAGAQTVFTGTVIETRVDRVPVAWSPQTFGTAVLHAQVAVTGIEKGRPRKLVEVWTSRYSSGCGYPLLVGDTYRFMTPDDTLEPSLVSTCGEVELVGPLPPFAGKVIWNEGAILSVISIAAIAVAAMLPDFARWNTTR